MNNHNSPEIIIIEDQNFGSHVEHWSLLTEYPSTDVPKWMGEALNSPIMPMGICSQECDMDQAIWLIQGTRSNKAFKLHKSLQLKMESPKRLKQHFRSLKAPIQ